MIESIKGGVRLHLFIQPKSSKNEVVGPHNGELKIKITAPPIDGRANEGLIEFLSDHFDIPKRSVVLVKGDTGRHKTVDLLGVDEEHAKELLKLK
ncbi:MAG: YggU family protein [Bdellovibrio sp.]|nr:YggU family protein [Bdellovibrio sp.]